MIMFFLPWWIYVLIGTVVFTSAFGGIWLAGIAFDRETGDETYPCLAHLGTDTDGAEDWCGQKHGHSGDHLGMRQYFDADETVSRVTSVDCEGFPTYTHECVISLGHTMADESTCFCCADHESSDFSHDQMRQTNAAGDVVIDENPGYLPGSAPLPSLADGEDLEYVSPGVYKILPPLPQRLSKVPAQTEHNDPWPVCGQRILFTGDMTCVLAKGHPGPHEHY